MACVDCLNNCSQIISDKCTMYTGPDIPLLGICTNSSLSTLESIIVTKLLSALDGTGITPAGINLSNCSAIKDALGPKDPTLINLLQTLIDHQCTLKTLINSLIVPPYSFDTKCLSGITSASKPNDVLQAAINTLCGIKTTVDSFPATYVKNSDIKTIINQIINEGNGNGLPNYSDRLVPYVAYEYYGELSNFDNTGKGLASAGFEKVYLCNGLNGTPDKRGRVTVGAIRNVPGGSLDPEVNPASAENPNTNYGLKDKFGKSYIALTVSQMPAHTHQITDPGHDHDLPSEIHYNGNVAGGESGNDEKAAPLNKKTGSRTTGISIQSSGGNQAHDNRQPSIAAYYIMYIP